MLKTEFLPEYWDYYKELKNNPNIDLLLLGQHMYSTGNGGYSFSLPYGQLVVEECRDLSMVIKLGSRNERQPLATLCAYAFAIPSITTRIAFQP